MVTKKNKARDLRRIAVKREYYRVMRLIIGIEKGVKNGNKYNKR